jgi:5-methylcytosine-specific restriction endonuclease McrA
MEIAPMLRMRDGGSGLQVRPQTEERECSAKIKGSQILELIEMQDYRCNLTGVQLTPQTASIDHKEPLSKGGPHDISNAQIVLDYVNRAKGSMSNHEFIAMCCAVADHHRLHGS